MEATTWASNDSPTQDHWIDVTLPSTRQLTTATIYWALNGSNYMTSQQVQFQYWNGSSFVTAGTFTYPGSNTDHSTITFPQVSTSRIRFYQPANQGNPLYPTVLWVTEVDYGLSSSLPGDLNADGSVNALDLQLEVNVILGTETNTTIKAKADLNGDGQANALDLQQLVNKVLGL